MPAIGPRTDAVYHGAKSVSAVYRGSRRIWPPAPVPPTADLVPIWTGPHQGRLKDVSFVAGDIVISAAVGKQGNYGFVESTSSPAIITQPTGSLFKLDADTFGVVSGWGSTYPSPNPLSPTDRINPVETAFIGTSPNTPRFVLQVGNFVGKLSTHGNIAHYLWSTGQPTTDFNPYAVIYDYVEGFHKGSVSNIAAYGQKFIINGRFDTFAGKTWPSENGALFDLSKGFVDVRALAFSQTSFANTQWYSDDYTLITSGGQFTVAGNSQKSMVAFNASDIHNIKQYFTWNPEWPTGGGINYAKRFGDSLFVWSDGGLRVGGVMHRYLVELDPFTGSVRRSFGGIPTYASGFVKCMERYGNYLFVGGTFRPSSASTDSHGVLVFDIQSGQFVASNKSQSVKQMGGADSMAVDPQRAKLIVTRNTSNYSLGTAYGWLDMLDVYDISHLL